MGEVVSKRFGDVRCGTRYYLRGRHVWTAQSDPVPDGSSVRVVVRFVGGSADGSIMHLPGREFDGEFRIKSE